jgi:hypothetical protein
LNAQVVLANFWNHWLFGRSRAEKKFEDQRDSYGRYREEYAKGQEDCPIVEVTEEFDLLYLDRGMKLTRALINAEYLDIAKVAKATRVWGLADQESQVGDHPEHGYHNGEEKDWV